MVNIFNTIINTLIRDVSYTARLIIAFALFFLAVLSLIWSIRRKNDVHPIAWGWMLLCIICVVLAILYITL
jgi:hypothetical protein